MDIRPIRTEDDYDWALAEIAAYFDGPPRLGTPEADRFDVLAALIETYEAKAWPIEPLDPVETIRHVMSERGLSQSDLAAVLGSRSRASEVLARRRPLTLAMIQRLRREWNIPADALINVVSTAA
jgi:HTH-type transcriptional regulator/antitoxin HigA